MEDELGELARAASTTISATSASVTFERELDEGLEEGAQQTLAQIERAIAQARRRHATARASGAARRSPRSGCGRGRGRVLCIDDQRLVDRGSASTVCP